MFCLILSDTDLLYFGMTMYILFFFVVVAFLHYEILINNLLSLTPKLMITLKFIYMHCLIKWNMVLIKKKRSIADDGPKRN